MAGPTIAQSLAWEKRYGSVEEAADVALEHPAWELSYVWGPELSYWERVARVS